MDLSNHTTSLILVDPKKTWCMLYFPPVRKAFIPECLFNCMNYLKKIQLHRHFHVDWFKLLNSNVSVIGFSSFYNNVTLNLSNYAISLILMCPNKNFLHVIHVIISFRESIFNPRMIYSMCRNIGLKKHQLQRHTHFDWVRLEKYIISVVPCSIYRISRHHSFSCTQKKIFAYCTFRLLSPGTVSIPERFTRRPEIRFKNPITASYSSRLISIVNNVMSVIRFRSFYKKCYVQFAESRDIVHTNVPRKQKPFRILHISTILPRGALLIPERFIQRPEIFHIYIKKNPITSSYSRRLIPAAGLVHIDPHRCWFHGAPAQKIVFRSMQKTNYRKRTFFKLDHSSLAASERCISADDCASSNPIGVGPPVGKKKSTIKNSKTKKSKNRQSV